MSIIGVGTSGLFDGVGILVQGENVIIQNLTMRYVLARDAIQVNNGRYVKIDHCTLYNESFDINPDKDKFDELISIKNNASHVIVSWNEIYNSHKTILVGSNDEVDALPDRKVIFHHNWFHDTGSRHPLYRGGHAHVYNNYYQRVHSAIDVRTNAKVLIENNHFEDVRGSIGYSSDYSGGIEVRGNHYIRVGGTIRTQSTLDIQFAGEYVYTLDPVEAVPDIVRAGAGVGKLPY
jgi:pectate lyase